MTTPRRPRDPLETPHLGSFQLSRSLAFAWLLYGLLALAAALALLGGARATLVPRAVREVVPYAFAGFLALFAVYRFALVRAGRYPPFRAFFQVGAGLLFILLLLPGTARQFGGAPARTLVELLDDPDPSVRALAAEVAVQRPPGRALARALAARLEDPSAQVREQAARALERLAGADVAAGADPAEARRRWEAWAEQVPAP